MNLNLSCIDLSVKDLLQCSFGLSKQEVSIFINLLGRKDWVTVAEISKIAKRDRSVVQRALTSLVDKTLVERDQKNKLGGGYEFLYRTKDKKMIKNAILEKSRAFSLMVQGQIRQW
ncbi:Sugar-specific transcriptional regulator TrmB [Candidatus Bilamarchaeum dharawalense]|uniref:Sugar-specific transcriptional regulator TrmB n=1 Tax=Candidatus Bilamarchaeum dharawalense TaxID=2885759 RepID=A0A5E4LT20_9ARCH|nr:Sugar-specific transcriptional regulator TrmB [Candidatus Bilamarchaeum dharawalense]